MATFVAKAHFALVCRVGNVATLRRAFQSALICEAVSIASIREDVNLGLQPRRPFTAELRRNGNIAVRCGEVDPAAEGKRLTQLHPGGWPEVLWHVRMVTLALLLGRDSIGALVFGRQRRSALRDGSYCCALFRSADSAKWPIVRSCVGRLSVLRYVAIPVSLCFVGRRMVRRRKDDIAFGLWKVNVGSFRGRRKLLRCARTAILATPWLEVSNENLRAPLNFAALRVMVKVGMLCRNLNFATQWGNASSATLSRTSGSLLFV